VGTFGEPIDKPLDREVLQKFVEGEGGFLGFVEKSLMHRGGRVFDVPCH
jgi:hypothetical protein